MSNPAKLDYATALRRNRLWLQVALLKIMRFPFWLRRLAFAGHRRYCVTCGSFSSIFLPHGMKLRQDARCPICGSLERHRLTLMAFKHVAACKPGKTMLHFAPESSLRRNFQRYFGAGYLSADLEPRRATSRQDITAMTLESGTFDFVCCNHVLEHVRDDRKALREIRRVLAPTGIALVQVPMHALPTAEDPSLDSPEERERRFGQHDHYRIYGPDFAKRCEEEGFSVTTLTWRDFCSASDAARFGVRTTNIQYLLTPRAQSQVG